MFKCITALVSILFLFKLEPCQTKSDLLAHISKRAAVGPLWPFKRIPYTFSNHVEFDAEARSKIASVLKITQNLLSVDGETCLEFVARDAEKDYILFVDNGDCSSGIGYSRGMNTISLSSNCLTQGTIMHEVMHRLGFDHEHSRPDREEQIEIFIDNLSPSNTKNFDVNSNELGEKSAEESPYDFSSLTHYNSNALQKSQSKPTLISRVPSLTSKNNEIHYDRDQMSNIDIVQVQKLYKCAEMRAPSIVSAHDSPTRVAKITKRFEIEANFIEAEQHLIRRYLRKTFDTCGLEHYWPVDYPLVESNHKHYQLLCQPKKATNEPCRFSIECSDDKAVCVRIFFKTTGICFKSDNDKMNELSQKINDGFFDKGKEVVDKSREIIDLSQVFLEKSKVEIVNKSKEVYEKSKELLTKGKQIVDKGKEELLEKSKELYEKSKELLDKGKEQIKEKSNQVKTQLLETGKKLKDKTVESFRSLKDLFGK